MDYAEAEFRKQLPSPDVYKQFLKLEAHGSRQQTREKIRRSLLIDALLKRGVEAKSRVSVAEALKMKPGEVSDLFQFGPNYTLFRLNSHTPGGKTESAAVKAQIQSDLQKARYNQLRSELHRRLRRTAKVEVL